MAEWLGREYNYDIWQRSSPEYELFRTGITQAGERAPDFRLPLPDGGDLALSSLRGKPTLIEFGSIS